jgi:hypothetical protein
MKRLNLFLIVTLASLAMAVPTLAAEGKRKKNKGPDKSESAPEKKGEPGKEPWLSASFTVSEKQVIQEYVKTFDTPEKPGKKSKPLPPGLQKKLARGGSLPPGWQKKIAKSEIMPVEVFKECHPLPPEVVVKLPAPPVGVITVTIEGKIVRLLEATHEILDVFEVWK